MKIIGISKKKLNLACCINVIFCVVISVVFGGCAFMPRTVLDSDSGNIIESVSTMKYNIHIQPLDNNAVLANNKDTYNYILGKNDQIAIFVWGHPEFSSPLGVAFSGDKSPLQSGFATGVNLTVANRSDIADGGLSSYTPDENGDIYFPMIGSVKIENRSVMAIKNELTQRLTKYVVEPQVSVRIASFRTKKTYVLGEVVTPKSIYLNDAPLDLATALMTAGWINFTSADVKNIYVLRLLTSNSVIAYRLDATSPANMLFANGFILRPDDIVFVSTAGLAQFSRVIGPIMNTAQTLWFTANIVPVGTKIVPAQ